MRCLTVEAEFDRPVDGVRLEKGYGTPVGESAGLPAWETGGRDKFGTPNAGVLTVVPPKIGGECTAIHLLGIFQCELKSKDRNGTAPGALVTVTTESGKAVTYPLRGGVHFVSPYEVETINRSFGDGISVSTVGKVDLDRSKARLDLVSIDIPSIRDLTQVQFSKRGTGAKFYVFDVWFDFENRAGCPFHHQSKGVSLDELGAVIRVGDRVRFQRALKQFEGSVSVPLMELDEARGIALTFLSVIAAALLELGASREMHRFVLTAARKLEEASTLEEVQTLTARMAEDVTRTLFDRDDNPTHAAIDRALAYIDKNFAKSLSDAELADAVGLSTSHFRYLFKQATGQPFHKYLIAVRLEKARRMLLDLDLSITAVARSTGFLSSAHFSRAFTGRFGVTPTDMKASATRS
ncbi:MAG: helix-turn-helix transcriptional regulator [Armatimonadetes bacterium]|nr:helix-turn-helix transcriptional regulator [Armatimonadota bacterium]